jgi:pyruvate kinase
MKTHEAVANSAIKSAFNLRCPVILGITDINLVTRYMSKYKPYSQMIVIQENPKLSNQVCLSRSMNGLWVNNVDDTTAIILQLLSTLK